jgi:hypothetical protein
MNTDTATRTELLRWIIDNASQGDLEAWAWERIERRGMDTLRDMVREINEYGEVRGDYDGD